MMNKTNDDFEDEFKDAVEYYLAKGFKMCKINLEEVQVQVQV